MFRAEDDDSLSHSLGQNSILSRVKTTLFYRLIRKKQQRFEVIRGLHGINHRILHTPQESNTIPAGDSLSEILS
eukprot:COSAG02_NODE_2281_length_9231_cov_15.017959_5_plen_74_part_00